MALSQTLIAKTVGPKGDITFEFADGNCLTFISQADVDLYVNDTALNNAMPNMLRLFLVAYNGKNGNVVNKTATYDLTVNSGNVVRIQ
jgi:hypothetical protein